jgi:hypothetical protein
MACSTSWGRQGLLGGAFPPLDPANPAACSSWAREWRGALLQLASVVMSKQNQGGKHGQQQGCSPLRCPVTASSVVNQQAASMYSKQPSTTAAAATRRSAHAVVVVSMWKPSCSCQEASIRLSSYQQVAGFAVKVVGQRTLTHAGLRHAAHHDAMTPWHMISTHG